MDTSIFLIVFSVKVFLNKRREGSFPYTLLLEDQAQLQMLQPYYAWAYVEGLFFKLYAFVDLCPYLIVTTYEGIRCPVSIYDQRPSSFCIMAL